MKPGVPKSSQEGSTWICYSTNVLRLRNVVVGKAGEVPALTGLHSSWGDSKQVKEKVRYLQRVMKFRKVIKARWHDERGLLGVFLEVPSKGTIDADP